MAGRLLLVWRLVRADIARRRVQSALLLAMIAATITTFTLGLALHGVTNSPFARTREATKGPDVMALFEPGFHGSLGTFKQFVALRRARGVVDSSGPYPVAELELRARGTTVRVKAEGRDSDRAALDQPLITSGTWVATRGIVLERGFADALGVHAGDTILLNGRRFAVRGIALTSAMPANDPLIWLPRRALVALTEKSGPLWYALNLKLAGPVRASPFADAHNGQGSAWFLESWQQLRADDSQTLSNEQQLLVAGSVLLAMIAIAGIAVLVGGRMAEQTRRVGLLKAVGATPRLIALVLLAENLLLALAATVVGLAVGWLIAPALTSPGNSMLGSAGSPALTPTTVALAAALAVVVAAAATITPALRGARTSTIGALTDPARPPQRQPGVIALSAWLPVSLLLALRLIVRRPRRTQLTIASVTIAVATVVAALSLHHSAPLGVLVGGNILAAARFTSIGRVANVLSAILFIVAAINVVFATWVSVLDAQRPTVVARVLGATARQITAGLVTAQLLPAFVAACLGIPLGLGLYRLANHEGSLNLPILWLLAVIPGTLLAVAGLTAIPARIGAHRPIAAALRSE